MDDSKVLMPMELVRPLTNLKIPTQCNRCRPQRPATHCTAYLYPKGYKAIKLTGYCEACAAVVEQGGIRTAKDAEELAVIREGIDNAYQERVRRLMHLHEERLKKGRSLSFGRPLGDGGLIYSTDEGYEVLTLKGDEIKACCLDNALHLSRGTLRLRYPDRHGPNCPNRNKEKVHETKKRTDKQTNSSPHLSEVMAEVLQVIRMHAGQLIRMKCGRWSYDGVPVTGTTIRYGAEGKQLVRLLEWSASERTITALERAGRVTVDQETGICRLVPSHEEDN